MSHILKFEAPIAFQNIVRLCPPSVGAVSRSAWPQSTLSCNPGYRVMRILFFGPCLYPTLCLRVQNYFHNPFPMGLTLKDITVIKHRVELLFCAHVWHGCENYSSRAASDGYSRGARSIGLCARDLMKDHVISDFPAKTKVPIPFKKFKWCDVLWESFK